MTSKKFIKTFLISSWNTLLERSFLHLITFLVMFSHSLETAVQEMAQLAWLSQGLAAGPIELREDLDCSLKKPHPHRLLDSSINIVRLVARC